MSGQVTPQTQTAAQPASAPLTTGHWQRAAVNPSPLHEALPIVNEVLRSPGQPLDTPTRAFMEPRFGHDFSGVRIHADAQAARSAEAVNALAYAVGRDVVFDAHQYQPQSMEGKKLIAHELSHVVQQGADPTAANEATSISHPTDATEHAADGAAHAALTGRALPTLGYAPSGRLHRAVKTFGGEFDTTTYTVINDNSGADAAGVGKLVGARINLKFTPNDLVESLASGIAMTQTVKTFRSTAAGSAINTSSNARTVPDALVAGEGDVGRGIDRVDFSPEVGSTLPTTNPLYGVHNRAADPTTGAAAHVSTSLTDTPPGGTASFGAHIRKPDRTFNPPVPATLQDRPRRQIAFAGQQWTQTFETAALVINGPMMNTYLGSVEWGWQVDAAGTATLNPAAIRMVRGGVPTTDFMDAANKWNRLQFTDTGTGTVHDTVDLPTTSDLLNSGMTLPSNRSTPLLLAWLDMINFQLQNLPGPSVDRTNKLFEKRALEAELHTRNILVNVNVVKTEDWTGADEVYARLKSGSRTFRTQTRSLNDGQSFLFRVPVDSLLPITDPILIEVYDEDLGNWIDRDDLIVNMNWGKPFQPVRNTRSLDKADYRVAVHFDR